MADNITLVDGNGSPYTFGAHDISSVKYARHVIYLPSGGDAIGQQLMASSLPVVLASDHSPIPVKGSSGRFSLSYTSPAATGTVAQTPVTGLDVYRSLFIYAKLTGATGDTLDIYLQASPDGGTTWVDYAHFPQISAGASAIERAWTVSRAAQQTTLATVGINLSPALAASTILGGDWGDRMRVVSVAGASTSAGAAQVILVSGAF